MKATGAVSPSVQGPKPTSQFPELVLWALGPRRRQGAQRAEAPQRENRRPTTDKRSPRLHGSSQTAALLVVLASSQTIQCALVSMVAFETTLGSSYWRDINKALVHRFQERGLGNTATQHFT